GAAALVLLGGFLGQDVAESLRRRDLQEEPVLGTEQLSGEHAQQLGVVLEVSQCVAEQREQYRLVAEHAVQQPTKFGDVLGCREAQPRGEGRGWGGFGVAGGGGGPPAPASRSYCRGGGARLAVSPPQGPGVPPGLSGSPRAGG